MKIKEREKILFYSVVGLLVGWFFVKVLFGSFHEKFVLLNKEALLLEAKFKKGIALIAHQEEINREYKKYETFFSVNGMSDEETVARFLKEIEKLGSNAGLIILDLKPKNEIESDKVSRQYPINLKAEGDFEQFVNFLYQLYHCALLFRTDRVTLTPKGKDSPLLKISMTISGIAFL